LAIAMVFAAAGAGALAACGSSDGDEPGAANFEPASAFRIRCAGCHGVDGGGGSGPKLNDGAVVTKYPNIEDQIAIVRDGRGAMPAFKDRNLSDDQIRALVEYTRTEL
jgi:mono/diheme cytochrome c family protein